MRMRCLGLLILAGLTVSCVQSPRTATPADTSGPGVVPFTLAGAGGAAVVVPVTINGQGPWNFVVDTGATLTCLDRSLVSELDLPEAAGIQGVGASIGSSGQVALHRVDTITVGDVEATDLTVCALDLGNMQSVGLDARGLLGLNVLKAYTVTFDFSAGTMTLAPPGGRR